MHLHELLDPELLGQMYDEDYIRVQYHPIENLAILNYTEKAAWEGVWNDVTRKCRGLIYNIMTMQVVARPFEKFFNYEQLTGTGWTPAPGMVTVTDKQDGSLGILYPLPTGGWAIATRGSFASDQALHATELLNAGLLYPLYLNRDITYLFEIIYPENRIVLNYGDKDELVLLGGVNIETGKQYLPEAAACMLDWRGPRTQTFPVYDFGSALAMPPRENAEGIVVYFHETGERVKIKQEDYVALHRLVTGMTDRSVWEALGQGQTISQIQEPLPEEFHQWVDDVACDLVDQAAKIMGEVGREFERVLDTMPQDMTRKDFALAVKDHPMRAYLFKYLDGEALWPVVWKSIKPAATRSMTTTSED